MLSNVLIDRIKLPFRKEKELFSSLYEILGFYPRNIEYYKLALMHKSLAHRDEKGKLENNERLEFLGDAVLDAVVGDIVYRHFDGKREGFLTNTRSKLVQRETLNRLAQEMGLENLLLTNGKTGSHNSYVGGNAFEALVGAIYLDRGYERCMSFMQKRILKQLINIDKVAYREVNFKSRFIEWCQKNKVNFEFETKAQAKEGSSPVFASKATIEGLKCGVGRGYSKKESQQIAAKDALRRLKREPQLIDAVFKTKSDRTKLEEQPVMMLPDTDEKPMIMLPKNTEETVTKATATPAVTQQSDKRHRNSKEDIIAAAEAAAFEGNE